MWFLLGKVNMCVVSKLSKNSAELSQSVYLSVSVCVSVQVG